MKLFYPISQCDWCHLPFALKDISVREIVAIPTGIVRFPKKGEWFLSGSVVEAYFATRDITSMQFPIAKLGRKKTVVTATAVPLE